MPPKKRARISQASTPQPKSAAEVTPAATDTSPDKPDSMNTRDPWTDEEEILLFKSIIKWKPTGLLKHFHVIAIATALSSHGFSANHTRIPGIWAKLRTLYDLDTLDERELTHIGIHPQNSSLSPEAESGEENEGEHHGWDEEFSLPEEQFGELMWTRRFDDEKGHEILAPSRTTENDFNRDRASSSPPAIEGLNEMRDYLLSTPETDGLKEMLGQFEDGEDEDEEEENTSVKDRGKKTAAGKAVKGRSARSTRSTPADEPEDDEDEEEEQTKAKPKRKRRRDLDSSPTPNSEPSATPLPTSSPWTGRRRHILAQNKSKRTDG